MRLRALLPLALLVGGCGGGPGTARPAPPPTGTAVAAPASPPPGSPAAVPTTVPAPTTPSVGVVTADPRLTSVQFAPGIAADGSALGPRGTYSATTDRRIIAVLSLVNMPVGTRISFTRYLDGRYVDTRTATVTTNARFFYFEFTALNAKQFATGQYRLRFYVDGKATTAAGYQVT